MLSSVIFYFMTSKNKCLGRDIHKCNLHKIFMLSNNVWNDIYQFYLHKILDIMKKDTLLHLHSRADYDRIFMRSHNVRKCDKAMKL